MTDEKLTDRQTLQLVQDAVKETMGGLMKSAAGERAYKALVWSVAEALEIVTAAENEAVEKPRRVAHGDAIVYVSGPSEGYLLYHQGDAITDALTYCSRDEMCHGLLVKLDGVGLYRVSMQATYNSEHPDDDDVEWELTAWKKIPDEALLQYLPHELP